MKRIVQKSQEQILHDLFILMSNLSQVHSRELILNIFLDAVNEWHPNLEIQILDHEKSIDSPIFNISTSRNAFGKLILLGNLDQISPALMATIRNAVSQLAVILENRLFIENANNAQKLSETRFSLAMRGAQDGLWDWNLETGEVYLSPRWKSMLGYEDDELEDHPDTWRNNLHPDDCDEAIRSVNDYLKGELDQLRIEFRMCHKEGYYVPILSRGYVVRNEAGKPVRLVGTHIDITERKQNELKIHKLNEELEKRVAERTIELAAANSELEAFSYTVSHDLRAPLRSIDGFSEILLEDCSKKLNDTEIMYIKNVRESVRDMSALIDGLLILSRMTKGELNQELIDLSSIAQTVIDVSCVDSPERNVICNITPNIMANGDPRLVKTLFDNLIGNAWKYSQTKIDARIDFGVNQENGETIYFVKDNGTGFDMAYEDKLFQPFQRLHKAEEFEGTGIGLATVQRIVQRHGGRIWAEAEVGKGAIFFFTLAKKIKIL
jgi:PAS domain S-box-containing protein